MLPSEVDAGGGKVFLQHARRVLAEQDVLTQAMAIL